MYLFLAAAFRYMPEWEYMKYIIVACTLICVLRAASTYDQEFFIGFTSNLGGATTTNLQVTVSTLG